MNWCAYNMLSIQNIQKYLKYLIKSVHGHTQRINIHQDKNILKYLIYLLTGVYIIYYHFKISSEVNKSLSGP